MREDNLVGGLLVLGVDLSEDGVEADGLAGGDLVHDGVLDVEELGERHDRKLAGLLASCLAGVGGGEGGVYNSATAGQEDKKEAMSNGSASCKAGRAYTDRLRGYECSVSVPLSPKVISVSTFSPSAKASESLRAVNLKLAPVSLAEAEV